MNKKWFGGLLTVLIVLPISAQLKTGLYIDSHAGAVQIKLRGASAWAQPAHKQSVTRLDSVRIPRQSRMTVVDAVSGIIYPGHFSFAGTVNQFLERAQKEQSSLLTELAKQLGANVLGKNKNTAHHVYGGATRTEEDDRYIDSIACLAFAVARAPRTPYPNLMLRTVRRDGTVRFIVDNKDDKAYYVNILMLNSRTDEMGLRIVLEPDMDPDVLLLPAGQSLDLSMFRFLDNPDMRYMLFATESPFLPATIHPLLRYPEDINCQ